MEDPELTEHESNQAAAAEPLTESVRPHLQAHKRNKGGRPRGAHNKVTLQIREAAQRLVSDPVYWRKLRTDLRKRRVHPQVETTLLAYAFGKPVDRIEVGRAGDFSKLTDDELVAALDRTLAELKPSVVGRLRRA
jgi:hypothetical protein